MYHSRLAMHQIFQKELYRFRIKTAKEFLSSLKTASTPISTNPNEPLKMNAQVQGIGPTFKLILKVQNISSTSPSINLFITFAYDEKLYKIATTYIEVSFQITRAGLDILSLFILDSFQATCFGARSRVSVQHLHPVHFEPAHIGLGQGKI